MSEYIICRNWKGWGVWKHCKDWMDYEPLEIFNTKAQAEAYKQELLNSDR